MENRVVGVVTGFQRARRLLKVKWRSFSATTARVEIRKDPPHRGVGLRFAYFPLPGDPLCASNT